MAISTFSDEVFSLKMKGESSTHADHLLLQSSILNRLEYIKVNRHCYSLPGVQNPGKTTDHLNLLQPSGQELKLFLGFSICSNLVSFSWLKEIIHSRIFSFLFQQVTFLA